MKIGAFILSLLLIGMSIQPMIIKWSSEASCASDDVSEKTILPTTGYKKTCSKAEIPPVNKPGQEKNKGHSNTCNPFMVCNGCVYMPAEQLNLESPAGGNIENTNWLYDESLSSPGSGFWHPPELFMHL